MEKIKLNIEVLKETNKTTLMIGDQEIEITKRISCADREAMATEYAANMIVIDEEKEMAFSDVGDILLSIG